ncbi:DNA-directed RNA polymerase subunit P [Candidatus Woesearchaeota archaeon]|nr:DNA-directed RNA polymerase subunit P [Candidatus Woesearchaeota archaeon]
MSEYRCFFCNKTISADNIKRRVRCIYCGSKIIFKSRSTNTKVKAR